MIKSVYMEVDNMVYVHQDLSLGLNKVSAIAEKYNQKEEN